MLDEERILQRLRLGEDSTTELKSVVASGFPNDSAGTRRLLTGVTHSICALANTRGGWLLLGVEDDGTVTGTGTRAQADDLMARVSNICHDAIEPPITCAVEKVELQGQVLLVVDVPAFGSGRPYRGGRAYYVRDANQSRLARRDELKRLLESVDYHYDEQPVPGATREALDAAAVEQFVRVAYEPASGLPWDDATADRYLRALQCLDRDGSPTVAGILFFAIDPTRWLPDARISVVRLQGTVATSDFLARKEIGGRLPHQVEAAAAFLDEHLRSPSHIEGWRRSEDGVPPESLVPQAALREALRNAVMHRDYRAASQTRVFLFDDRVELINPGTLLNQLTLDSIRLGGITQRRNPAIANLLNRRLARETLGVGIPEMIRCMRACGLPEPEFDLRGGHFRVILRARPAGAM